MEDDARHPMMGEGALVHRMVEDAQVQQMGEDVRNQTMEGEDAMNFERLHIMHIRIQKAISPRLVFVLLPAAFVNMPMHALLAALQMHPRLACR
jgi:hypothetical protein